MTFDERLALLESQMKTLDSQLRSSTEAQARKDASTLDARLAPGLLPGATPPGVGGGMPSMASPLIDRLRADGNLRGSFGSTQAAVSSNNLLHDAGMSLYPSAATFQLGTWKDLGAFWQSYMSSVSGTAPDSPASLDVALNRSFWGSRAARAQATWSAHNDGVAHVYIRSTHPAFLPQTPSVSDVDWPYITGSVRCLAAPFKSGGTLSGWNFEDHPMRARVSIIDGNSGAWLATGDWSDIGVGFEAGLEGRPYVVLEDWQSATSYAPLLQVQFEFDSAAYEGTTPYYVAMMAYFGEPTLNYSEEPGPAPYQPILGRRPGPPDMLGVEAHRTAGHVTADSTLYQMSFPVGSATLDWDHGFWGGSGDPGNFYFPATGYYDVAFYAAFAPTGSGDQRVVQIYKGAASGGAGTLWKTTRLPPVNSTWTDLEVRDTMFLNVNHRVYGTIWHNAGANREVYYSADIRLVGAPEEAW